MPDAAALHLGIDATNIRGGGGVTHLSQLLQAGDPPAFGFGQVTVWASRFTAEALPKRSWLVKRNAPWMEGSLLGRATGQFFRMPRQLAEAGCDVLFSPGGTLPTRCPVPMVTMSQNMLPFEPLESARFGKWSAMRQKMRLLRYTQGRSFKRANGIIFLTRYAKIEVSKSLGSLSGATALIPHGIESRFLLSPRPQRPLAACSKENPFRVLYVSILMPYKHQMEVAIAASQLRSQGVPIEVRFIGDPWGRYGRQFRALLDRLDPSKEFLLWSGSEPFLNLHYFYQKSDAFAFASSCENLPNIMIEAMAAGLPIASSDRGPMPEVLGESGIYFDPESPSSIASALHTLAGDTSLRTKLAESAWGKAQAYSWARCAGETFAFIAQVARQQKVNPHV